MKWNQCAVIGNDCEGKQGAWVHGRDLQDKASIQGVKIAAKIGLYVRTSRQVGFGQLTPIDERNH